MRTLAATLMMIAVLCPLAAPAQKGKGKNNKKQSAKSDPSQSPWTEPDPGYAMKVEVLKADHQNTSDGHYISVKTFGSGNVLGDKMAGFDFKSTCTGGLETGTYESKWKKQDKKIEVLTLISGKTKSSTCTIDVEMKAHPYAKPKDSSASDSSAAAAPAATDTPSTTPAANGSTDPALKDSTAPPSAPMDDTKPAPPPADGTTPAPAAPATPPASEEPK